MNVLHMQFRENGLSFSVQVKLWVEDLRRICEKAETNYRNLMTKSICKQSGFFDGYRVHQRYGLIGRPCIDTKPDEYVWVLDGFHSGQMTRIPKQRWDLYLGFQEWTFQRMTRKHNHWVHSNIGNMSSTFPGYDVHYFNGHFRVSLSCAAFEGHEVDLPRAAMYAPWAKYDNSSRHILFFCFLSGPFIEQRFSGYLIQWMLRQCRDQMPMFAEISKYKSYAWCKWMAEHIIRGKALDQCPMSPLLRAICDFDMNAYAETHRDDVCDMFMISTGFMYRCNFMRQWLYIWEQFANVSEQFSDREYANLKATPIIEFDPIPSLMSMTIEEKRAHFLEHIHYQDRFQMIMFLLINDNVNRYPHLPMDITLQVLDKWFSLCYR